MRRFSLGLVALALACTPDVHVHVYDDDGDDTDGQADTDSGFGPSGNDSNASASGNDSSASASGNDSNPTASGNDSDPTTDSDTSAPTTGDDTSDTGSSGGGIVDQYPQPEGGACPDGFGYNADGTFEFCGPPCGEGDSCPDTASGNVLTSCVFNPDSSMDPCMAGMCENPDETCFANQCMLPATHCAPLCSTGDAVCPDGMECTTNDVCRFPM
ncbi:MAG: hypothetical protein ACE37F_29965 [Nannocystaceae bacterium]|nr:hypothetical protein [bacterium]